MDQKTIDMVNRIMDTERMGYAYVYPADGETMGGRHPMGEENPKGERHSLGADNPREEYLIATTPENMAGFIASHHDAQRITVTDIADRLLLDASDGLIKGNPGSEVRAKIITRLAQIQAGEKETGEVLQIERKQSDAYFAAEDRAVVMAEYGMECGMG
ncbi:MAG: hypothetical protein NC489_24020 [Ruminococcus flavefaciens]|nr:hypothetical protein [Ruminococcus flavefaciens]